MAMADKHCSASVRATDDCAGQGPAPTWDRPAWVQFGVVGCLPVVALYGVRLRARALGGALRARLRPRHTAQLPPAPRRGACPWGAYQRSERHAPAAAAAHVAVPEGHRVATGVYTFPFSSSMIVAPCSWCTATDLVCRRPAKFLKTTATVETAGRGRITQHAHPPARVLQSSDSNGICCGLIGNDDLDVADALSSSGV